MLNYIKKIIVLVLSIFLISGCDANYELNYKNGIFEEKLTINNYVVNSDELFLIDHYKNDNIYSDINDKVVTDKKIKSRGGNRYNLKFIATYDEESYNNSLAITSCFEYYKYEEDDDNIYIALYGDYYCDTFDKLKVVFKTDKKINYSNAHAKILGKLVWEFNPEDDMEIELEISKNEIESPLYIVLFVLFVTILISILLYLVYKFYVIYKKNRDV